MSKLNEAIADLCYCAGEHKLYSDDSRADMQTFIAWAKEFETLHAYTDWQMVDYMETIEQFFEEKAETFNK